MAEEQKKERQSPFIIPENEVPGSWAPIEIEAINPNEKAAAPPPAAGSLPPYFRGSLAPALQHDAYLVATDKNPRVASMPLMPTAPSANPQNNAAIQSSIIENKTSTTIVSSTGMNFRGDWLSFANYKQSDVVLFNEAAYVALQASVGAQPDLDLTDTNWELLSENFVFNPAIVTTGSNAGWGVFDKSQLNHNPNASATHVIVGPATPAAVNELGLLAITQNAFNLSGWVLVSNDISGGLAGGAGLMAKTFPTTVPINEDAGLFDAGGGATAWSTNLLLFASGGASLTASVTSITLISNVVTCQAINGFIVGTQILFPSVMNNVNDAFLANQLVQITAVTATSFTFAFTHANTGPNVESVIVSNLPYLQRVVSQGALANGTFIKTFPTPTKAGSLIVAMMFMGDINATGSFNSVTDSALNTYTIKNDTASTGGARASLAFVQNAAGGVTTVTMNVTSNSAGTYFAIYEFPGAGAGLRYNYIPYDVQQFRGSIFVCLKETTLDAFADPASWGLLSQGTGTVDLLTGNYTAVVVDSGRLITFNSSSVVTLNLPATPPQLVAPQTSGWWIAVENTGAGLLTINRNGNNIDGLAANITLTQNQGVFIFTDGLAYFTLRGAQEVNPSVSSTGNTTTQSGNLRFNGAVLPAGLWSVAVYAVVTASGAGNLGATITWQDESGAQSVSPATISTTAIGTVFQFTLVVKTDGIHDVTYAFTLS